MGKVAVVGGSSNVARDVIDAILKKGDYEVTICSRKPEGPADLPAAVKWVMVDYDDQSALVAAFSGIDTILSFVATGQEETSFRAEKQIIDAAVAAGVKRIAPSQWSAKSNSGIAHYSFKDKVSEYLASINAEKQVIQYTLFQPGFFIDYLAYPHRTTPHFHTMRMMFDFSSRRALITSGTEDSPITLTSVSDLSTVVAFALSYPGVWPTVGGIQGSQTTAREIIALGEKLRGKFEVTKVDAEKVREGNFEVPWMPIIDHPSVPVAYRESVSKMVLREYLISAGNGGWAVGGEWNELLGADVKVTGMEEFLTKVWGNGA